MNVFTINGRHRLERHGKEVAFRPPLKREGGVMPTRRLLVMHFTAGWSADSTVQWWRKPSAKGTSAHLLIDRDGTVIQVRAFNQTAGHAGTSSWKDPKTGVVYTQLNRCSIGIELCNAGDAVKERYPVTTGCGLGGKRIPTIEAKHKHGGRKTLWEVYPLAQLEAARAVAEALVKRYRLDDVVGHEDVAPGRKVDPGPAFPMREFRAALGFTKPLPKHT